MEKCRLCQREYKYGLCLKSRKRFRPIYNDALEGITYAVVVSAISNVKATKNDGFPDNICFACCQRLKDVYEFKIMIERSDIELQKTCKLKRIIYTNIEDVKCKIEVIDDHSQDTTSPLNDITEKFTRSSKKILNYNDTVIKKLSHGNSDVKKSLSVKEFLHSMKPENNDCNILNDFPIEFNPVYSENEDNSPIDYESDCERRKKTTKTQKKKSNISEDEDYIPGKVQNKIKKSIKSKNKENMIQKTVIKPVHLANIRVAFTPRYIKRKQKTSKNNGKRRDICPICGKMVISLKNHVLTHAKVREKNFKCEICAKSFQSNGGRNVHQANHTRTRDLKCELCFSTFSSPEKLKRHMLIHTGGNKIYPCKICDKAFSTSGHVLRHIRSVHGTAVKNIHCDLCTMSFTSKFGLKHHLRVHTGERPYKCEICSQPYSYKNDFIRHCLKKHGVFLKGRPVNVMNEEVMRRERALMKDLRLRVNGVVKDDNLTNPFEGPHASRAFEQAVVALKTNQITVDLL